MNEDKNAVENQILDASEGLDKLNINNENLGKIEGI